MASLRLIKSLPSFSLKAYRLRPFASSSIPTGLPADPEVHAVSNLDDNDPNEISYEKSKTRNQTNPSVDHDHIVNSNTPLSSPKLKSTPITPPTNPKTHQTRHKTTTTTPIIQAACVGIDGYPETDHNKTTDRQKDRKEQELDDKEYFKHHKASPLSEIEIADTRKPVTRATDGTADSKYNSGGGDVITWLPEQMVSADETMRRAMEIFKMNGVRGDPDSPHGRRLRELRGEWW